MIHLESFVASVKTTVTDPLTFLGQRLISYVHPEEISLYNRWKQFDVRYVNDVFHEGRILGFEEIAKKIHAPVNFIQYFKVVNRFPRTLVRYIKEKRLHVDTPPSDDLVEKVINSSKLKFIYSHLVSAHKCQSDRKMEKWSQELGETLLMDDVFSLPHACATESQVKRFQFNLTSKILPTNVCLKKIKILSSDLCTFCSTASESYEHLFCSCSEVDNLWGDFVVWAKKVGCLPHDYSLKKSHILLGSKHFSQFVNYILLLIKMYIYQCRSVLRTPSFKAVPRIIEQKQNTEGATDGGGTEKKHSV